MPIPFDLSMLRRVSFESLESVEGVDFDVSLDPGESESDFNLWPSLCFFAVQSFAL